MRIAFLASHNGSSARAITQACDREDLKANPAVLISNNPESNALKWARDEKLKTYCLNDKNIQDPDREIANILEDHKIDRSCPHQFFQFLRHVRPYTEPAFKRGPRLMDKHPDAGHDFISACLRSGQQVRHLRRIHNIMNQGSGR